MFISKFQDVIKAKARDIDGAEGFVFAYLHKWSFNFIK